MSNDVGLNTGSEGLNSEPNGIRVNEPLSADNIKLGIAIAFAGLLVGGISIFLLFNRGDSKHAGASKAHSPAHAQVQTMPNQFTATHSQVGHPAGVTPASLPGLLPNADPAAAALVLQVTQQHAAAAQAQQFAAQPGITQQSTDGSYGTFSGMQAAPAGAEMQSGPVQIDSQGQVLTETVSGYPIYNSGAPKAVDAGGDNPNWNVTRSGLVGNPCVDPPSVRGRAYSTSNAY